MDVSSPLAFVGLAILFVCFGLAIVKSALLPKWLGWIAFPHAVLAMIPVDRLRLRREVPGSLQP